MKLIKTKFKILLLHGLIVSTLLCKAEAQNGGKLKMWYDKPATTWNEALPIGNGRLGAMIYGNPLSEKIQLNEGTFWSGGPSNNDNPKALNALGTVRQMIFNGNYTGAVDMINQNMTATQLHGSKYQVIGNLVLSFAGHNSYTDYYRELDLSKALFTTRYNINGITYKREVISSRPDELIVVRLSASESGKLTFTASFNGELQKTVKAVDSGTLEMTGLSSTHEGVKGQVKFDARARIINSGGTRLISGSSIKVTNADEVIILISIATNFIDYKTITADEVTNCIEHISKAEGKTYDEMLSSHIKDFQEYFDRVTFDLGTTSSSEFPTDIRIKNFAKTTDPDLISMYFQFGRYLLISCSRPGGQPATLQGLWNESTSPAWDSKYTININTEMNYWPAEKCNLTEMHEPLVQMLKELKETGQKTATNMYGCDGWVVHHNTDLWRTCGVVDFADAGMWPMGGAWLSQHLWEKFSYSGDVAFLDTVYPILKSACEFYQDFLIEEPKNGWLVVSPSISPENNPKVRATSIVAGATIDNQILFDLFSKTIKAAKILKRDSLLMVDLQKILDKLPPMQIGKLGQLQEWMEDWDSPTDQNRHVSHLYGLYPGNQISPYSSPELFDAARTSLLYRGDVSTGWSMGWKVNLWARLLDGNHARKLISDQISLVDPVNSGDKGGTYPNMFDAHPPFQIDGNFGCTSGIAEMLMQSHDGSIHILPALPDDWKNGKITGLKANGGFETDITWEKGIVTELLIVSKSGGNCRLRLPNEMVLNDGTPLIVASGENSNPFYNNSKIKEPVISASAKLNETGVSPGLLFDLPTEAGKRYHLVYAGNPEFKLASIYEEEPSTINVAISEDLLNKDTFDGFTVKADNQLIEIDSIRIGGSPDQIFIYLKDSIKKDDEVLLSYNNGNITSKYGKQLIGFTDTLVYNFLTGSSPYIYEAVIEEDGNSIYIRFSTKMEIPSDFSSLTLTADYNGIRNININSGTYAREDSTAIIFTLSERIYSDYLVTLNYSGENIVSSDSGFLKKFTNMFVNNYSSGLPVVINSGKIEEDGKTIILESNKELSLAVEQENFFTVKVNGVPVTISDATAAGSKIEITLSKIIRWGEIVTVDYINGNITATDSGILENFSNYEIKNLVTEPSWFIIPSRIEAEKSTSQSGTQNESTGDTEGIQNVGWIDAGDWLEYAVNNNTTDTLFQFVFRVASPAGGGNITVYADNEKIGSISIPATGGWQTYISIKKDLKIKPGKHYIKLYAAAAGFNINYFEVKKKDSSSVGQNMEGRIKVFPNPAKKYFFIESTDFIYNKVEIFDVKGMSIYSLAACYEANLRLPVNINDGVYFLKISNSEQIQFLKLLVKND